MSDTKTYVLCHSKVAEYEAMVIFMLEYKQYKLGDVCTRLSSGKNIPASQVYDEGAYPVYGGNGLRGYTNHSNFIGDCAIIGRQGAFCGNVRYFHGEAYMTEHAVVVCANEDNNTRYLAYLLSRMNLGRLSGQSAQPGLSVKTLAKQVVDLPPLEVQNKVVAVLSSFDSKIALNNEINYTLFEMVNAYYASHFKNTDNEMTTIGNYADRVYSGGTPSTSNAEYWNGAFGWFSSGETRNRFVISTEKSITQTGIDNSSTKLAEKYDIVMASAGQGFTRGQTSMLLLDTYVNQSVIVIHADRKVLPYLFWNLTHRYEELRAISDSSSIRGSLTTKMISAFEIPKAEDNSLQAFSDFAWSVIPQIENNLLENECLMALHDSLLPKLMAGEIDIPDIQI